MVNNCDIVLMKNLMLFVFIMLPFCFYGCKTVEEKGYNCIDGDCVPVFEDPQYHTLEDCLTLCGNATGSSGYRCVNGSCVWVEEGAQYKTLAECQKNCSVSNTSGYRCVNGNCVAVNSNAEYKTLAECQKNCGSNTGSTNATVTFVVYQRCSGTQPGNSSSPASFLNGAKINLATSQSNLNDKVFFYSATTNNYGKASISELKPQTYYYQINGVVCKSNAIRSRTGSITLKSNDNIERRIDLY